MSERQYAVWDGVSYKVWDLETWPSKTKTHTESKHPPPSDTKTEIETLTLMYL